jgi:hypothetical protein
MKKKKSKKSKKSKILLLPLRCAVVVAGEAEQSTQEHSNAAEGSLSLAMSNDGCQAASSRFTR